MTNDIRHRKNGSSKKARKNNKRYPAVNSPGHDKLFGSKPPFWSAAKQAEVNQPSR